jgi:predicted nucleic acid-binding protein
VLYYLDTMIVIYAVEGNAADQQRARDHLAALSSADHRFAISDLTYTECLVHPLRPGFGPLLSDFFRFFHGPNLRTLTVSSTAHARAGAIRAHYNYGLADAVHLAAAIESGCDVFLTNDNQLSNFPDINIEELR